MISYKIKDNNGIPLMNIAIDSNNKVLKAQTYIPVDTAKSDIISRIVSEHRDLLDPPSEQVQD